MLTKKALKNNHNTNLFFPPQGDKRGQIIEHETDKLSIINCNCVAIFYIL